MLYEVITDLTLKTEKTSKDEVGALMNSLSRMVQSLRSKSAEAVITSYSIHYTKLYE